MVRFADLGENIGEPNHALENVQRGWKILLVMYGSRV
jgi:hypothetical protein